MKKCKIKDCESGAYCRGWCKKHYTRWERYGDPNVIHERHRFTKADITKAVDANKTYRTKDDSLYFIWVEYEGKRMCLFDFAKQVGVSNSTLWWRYKNNKEVFPGAVVTSGSF